MADKTFGVKVSDEVYDKVKLVIEANGITAKDWFEKAVSLYEINAIKQGSSDYTQDLSELEHHTTRIYELIANMIQRSISLKDYAVKEYVDKLISKESIIVDLQQKLAAANEGVKTSVEELEKVKESDIIQQLQLEEARKVSENNQLLIEEYKEKNDTLSELVARYKNYDTENNELKEQLNTLQVNTKKQLVEIHSQADTFNKKATRAEETAERLKEQHAEALQMLEDKKDLERDKAILELERTYQTRNVEMNDQYNEKIRALYDELATARKTNDALRQSNEVETKELAK